MADVPLPALIAHEDDFEWSYLSDAPGPSDIRWKTFTGGDDSPTKDITFGICEVPPGGRLRPHHHAESEVYYIIGGTGEVLLDNDVVKVAPGSVLFVPADLVHGIRNRGTETLSMLWIFPVNRWTDVEYHGAEREF
ncbi:MAG: cupin domain-containing protein [Pseudomonadota bacterium]